MSRQTIMSEFESKRDIYRDVIMNQLRMMYRIHDSHEEKDFLLMDEFLKDTRTLTVETLKELNTAISEETIETFPDAADAIRHYVKTNGDINILNKFDYFKHERIVKCMKLEILRLYNMWKKSHTEALLFSAERSFLPNLEAVTKLQTIDTFFTTKNNENINKCASMCLMYARLYKKLCTEF